MLDALTTNTVSAPAMTPEIFAARHRPPPTAVKCVIPVWGYAFIRQFLEVGLPTMLAPGNVPALAEALPCEFIILTSYEDEPFIRLHPGFRRLSDVCKTEIRLIDHLITGTNYSTTITLAYAEVVRSAGAAKVDTAFFFLVSDYIVADGSFKNALARVMNGASGVLTGNFQVGLEDALPWLQEKLNASPDRLSLSARELMRWGLSHLHPATVANVANYPLSHNRHTNRIFWRVDGETLIGRFYLMHMLCIRPEVSDFVIGAACDYSFVPEMCPSNNVEIIGDSDEYLVIEMQPWSHETKFLKPGPLRPRALARTLSEWTTARHRENSSHSVIFHSGELPTEKLAETEAAADSFLEKVRTAIKKKASPHRSHPYWRGASAAFHEATGRKLSLDEWRLVLGLPDPSNSDSWVSDWVVEKIRFALFGRPPMVRPWHPRWADYQLVLKGLKGYLADYSQSLLMVSDSPTVFTASLSDDGERAVRLRSSHFLDTPVDVFEPMFARFDVCLMELTEADANRGDELIDRVTPMMKPGGKIMVMIYNKRKEDAEKFAEGVSTQAARFLRPGASPEAIRFLPATPFRWGVLRSMTQAGELAKRNPVVGIPMLFVSGWALAASCYVANMVVRDRTKEYLKRGKVATSVLILLRVNEGASRDAYKYSGNRIVRQRLRRRRGLPDVLDPRAPRWLPALGQADHDVSYPPTSGGPQMLEAAVQPEAELVPALPRALGADVVRLPVKEQKSGVADARPPARREPSRKMVDGEKQVMDDGTREPQYNRCVELRDEFGLTPLGLMTNQVFYDDPRRLGILLARYKFVAKMLSGKKFVAEVGCGDAFGTRVVLQEVEQVVAYDFDPVFIDDIRHRQSDRWPIEARLHDIVLDTLPDKHDGIYSLDVIEHIRRQDEHAYLANLRGSLDDDGVLIIGTPSIESQTYASPPSKAGHINCKSGMELKVLLQQYFTNVFVFSMNDEVVHTGFYPMAHYLFAVCCGPK